MVLLFFKERRILVLAHRRAVKASGMEGASRRRMDGGGDIPRQDDSRLLQLGIGYRGCGQEGLRIGMQGPFVKDLSWGDLNDFSQVHDRDPVADMFHDR